MIFILLLIILSPFIGMSLKKMKDFSELKKIISNKIEYKDIDFSDLFLGLHLILNILVIVLIIQKKDITVLILLSIFADLFRGFSMLYSEDKKALKIGLNRICSILTRAKSGGVSFDIDLFDEQNFDFQIDEERELIKMLALYPAEIETVARTYDCSLITKYAINLASAFHKFYSSCKVVTDDECITNFRLLLCICTKTVLNNVLSLMKIEAPEKM